MAKFENKDGKLFIDNKEVLKGWESFSGWYWFATEKMDENTYFGFVQGFEEEWGDFSLLELNPLILQGKIWALPKKALTWSGRR